MKERTLLNLLCGLCCVVLFQQSSDTQAQDSRSSSLRINGTVVGIGGRFGGRTRPFTLIANSYTAPNQVRELNDALQRGGQDELLRALSGMDAGRIQIGTGVGVPANVIIAGRWGEGGTKLTVFYQRNISFYELRYGTRSEDYRIGYAGNLPGPEREGARDGNPGGSRQAQRWQHVGSRGLRGFSRQADRLAGERPRSGPLSALHCAFAAN